MIHPAQLRLFEHDVHLAVELALDERTRDGYLLLDLGLAAVEAARGEWSDRLAEYYRKAMVEYTEGMELNTPAGFRPQRLAGGPQLHGKTVRISDHEGAPLAVPPPILFKVIPELRLVQVHLKGTITADDLREYQNALGRHPDHQRDFRALVVLAEDTELPAGLTVTDFGRELARDVHTPSRRALVGRRPQHLAMIRMLQLITDGTQLQLQAFQAEEDARAWLELPPALPSLAR